MWVKGKKMSLSYLTPEGLIVMRVGSEFQQLPSPALRSLCSKQDACHLINIKFNPQNDL